MKKTVIVIPTYNERENILNLLRALENVERQAYQLFYRVHILVVDDNSPDGTGKIVEDYQKDKDNIQILYGKKEGLGRAYLRGFKHAKQKMRADIIVQMDADFSHRPEDVLRLLKHISAGADYVVGSRYTAGGTVPASWPLWRRLNSQVANLVARYLAGLHKIKDCTSGFKAINIKALKNIRWDKLKVNGYVFQVRLLHEALRNNIKIFEMPINFTDRTFGKSKMGLSDIVEFIFQSLAIRWDKSRRAIKFIIGASLGVYAIIYFNQHPFVWQPNNLLIGIFTTFSIMMTVQSLATIFGMLHVWDKPEHLRKSTSPKRFVSPRFSFTAMIPALHEEAVIGETIEAVSKIDYPEELKEVLVICRSDDQSTIDAVNTKIRELKKENIKLVIPNFRPRNKPDKLNFALNYATKDVIGIFDAEDTPHTDIYNIINTVMQKKRADVVQSGVQLINYRSRWFSALNVLEYFFWFKSVLHIFAKMKVMFLGGNTVFFKTRWLKKVKGWNADCLTEDADIGVRLSQAGARMHVVYDELHATREETPPTWGSFVRQRTRWNQGFIQIFREYEWAKLPKLRQKILSGYILIWPEMQALLFFYIILSFVMIFTIKLPILVALVSYLPLYILTMQIALLSIGIYEFTKKYNLAYSVWTPFKILATFIPYQLTLGLSAVRAVYREINHKNGWEKTEHINAHREVPKTIPAQDSQTT